MQVLPSSSHNQTGAGLVKCPAISRISHCQVIKWGQDTCSSASVRAAWTFGSGVLISCHGFMMEINPEMPFLSELHQFKQGHSHGNWLLAMAEQSQFPYFRRLPYISSAFLVHHVKAEKRPCLVRCLNKSQCHEAFYSVIILHYDFCDTAPLFSRLVVLLHLYQMY